MGTSPRIPMTESYITFFKLVTTQITGVIANARNLEAARRRAEELIDLDRVKTVFFR